SAARLGYLHDPFVTLFVRQPVRRSPLINRGTMIRNKAVDSLVQQFMEAGSGKKQVVVLGAGFDTRYFTLQSKGVWADRLLRYYEVDFPEITVKKAMAIQQHAMLHQLLGPRESLQFGGTELVSEKYCLIGGDLREWTSVVERLLHHGLDVSIPTLFLSECVFVYLPSQDSHTILEWITREVQHAMCVLYEQIHPKDAFGKMMLKNLQERHIELKGIHAFPDQQAQEERFRQLCWQEATAVDMNILHDRWLEESERVRMASLEILDELEEWTLLARHYCVAWAYKSNDKDSPLKAVQLLCHP
ncbi:S-adenosyl-L-methionine-dependent methyltransferase, partial [Spinellus fusiger]